MSDLTVSSPARDRVTLRKSRALVALLGLLGLAFLPIIATAIVPQWFGMRGFYSHGFIVLAMTVSLIWSHRHRLFSATEPGSLAFAVAAGAASALWLVAWAADLLAVELFAVVGTMLLAGCAVLGRRSLWTFGAPFALLWFAVPMWAPIEPPLQLTAAAVVRHLVGWAGIPVYIDANFVHVPAGTFEIERGCSGLGFLLTSLSLSGYLILSVRPAPWRAAALAATAVVFGLAANWIRIMVIVLVGQRYGMESRLVHDHVWLGWVIYTVLMVPALWAVSAWLRPDPKHGAGPAEPPDDRAGARADGRVSARFLALVVAASALLPALSVGLDHLQRSRPLDLTALPPAAGGFRNGGSPNGKWDPDFPQADHTEQALYRDGSGLDVMAFTASYASQRDGHEAVSILNDLGGPGWLADGQRSLTVPAEPRPVRVTEKRFRSDRGKLCVWYWYRVAGVHAGTDVAAKLAQIRRKLVGRSDAKVMAVAALTQAATCDPVRDELMPLARALITR